MGTSDKQPIRLGTRGSKLAVWQADWVTQQLQQRGVDVVQVRIETMGDVRAGPIGQMPAQGVFTKEIQRALLENRIDVAVHSLKDLPTQPIPGLRLAAVPTRAWVGDALLARAAGSLAELAEGASVATGSARRRAQLLAARPDLQLVEVRGNIDTRIRKLNDGQFDAMVLAEAGLKRLGLDDLITQVLDKRVMLPAVGQGALGLEVREEDPLTTARIAALNDPDSLHAVTAERRLLADMHGGCLAPIGAWARRQDHELVIDAIALRPDGQQSVRTCQSGPPSQAVDVGAAAARHLLDQGAADLIR